MDDKACSEINPHSPHAWGAMKMGDREPPFFCPGVEISGVVQGVDAWDRPEHYGGEVNPFEPIKIIEHYDLNFNLGNAIKYVLKAPFKGTALKDLKKAYTYLGFEIRKRERAGETE